MARGVLGYAYRYGMFHTAYQLEYDLRVEIGPDNQPSFAGPASEDAFEETPACEHLPIRELFGKLRETGGTLHLMGLVSDGGVHSHQDQLYAMLEACGRRGIPTAVHALLDGRDTPPSSGRAMSRG